MLVALRYYWHVVQKLIVNVTDILSSHYIKAKLKGIIKSELEKKNIRKWERKKKVDINTVFRGKWEKNTGVPF